MCKENIPGRPFKALKQRHVSSTSTGPFTFSFKHNLYQFYSAQVRKQDNSMITIKLTHKNDEFQSIQVIQMSNRKG